MTWATSETGLRRVVVTGAAGRIGSYFAEHHNPEKYTLRLMTHVADDPERVSALARFGEVVSCELADQQGLTRVFDGADTVVHLAGNPDPSATWSELLDANIVGTYHAFTAAKAAGCRRIVYASSIHAVSGYPNDIQVKTHEPVNPGDLYGVTKCFGEALARYIAEQEDVSAIAIRIGAFQPLEAAQDPKSLGMMDAFVSHRDLHQLIECAIDAPGDLRFAIVHGLSNNRFKRLDISDTRQLLDYAPQDDLTDENPNLRDLHLTETVTSHNVQDAGQESGLREEIVSPGR